MGDYGLFDSLCQEEYSVCPDETTRCGVLVLYHLVKNKSGMEKLLDEYRALGCSGATTLYINGITVHTFL